MLITASSVQFCSHNKSALFSSVLERNRRQDPGPVVTQCKAYCFELILRDAGMIRFPVGKELSASEWDRCQTSIVSNLKGSGNSGLES